MNSVNSFAMAFISCYEKQEKENLSRRLWKGNL